MNLPKPPQTLSSETKFANFCYCIKSANAAGGWTVDPVTRRGVCYICGKPAPMTGIRNCADCETEFIDFDQPRWIVWPNGNVTPADCYCIACE